MPCPPSIAQRKQASLVEGLRNTCSQAPIVAPTPSLTAEANIASGEPIDLRAAESRRLMLLSRASDSASSVFLRLTMYADPLAERVWSRLGGTHTSRSGTVDARPQGTP